MLNQEDDTIPILDFMKETDEEEIRRVSQMTGVSPHWLVRVQTTLVQGRNVILIITGDPSVINRR